MEQRASSSGGGGSFNDPIMDMLHDSFPYHAGYKVGVGEDNRDDDLHY